MRQHKHRRILKSGIRCLANEEDREHMDTDIRQRLRQFLSENLIKEQTGKTVEDNDSFFEKNVIDSTGVLELVLFLEQTFGFVVEDEEIVPENLDSINRLAAFVQSKLPGPGVQG